MITDPTNPTMESATRVAGEAAHLWESTKERANEALQATKERANEALQTTKERANEALQATKERATEALQSTERYVQEHPATSVLGVFGAGILVGGLIAWSIAHEQRQDSADVVHQFLKRLGRKLNID